MNSRPLFRLVTTPHSGERIRERELEGWLGS